MKPIREVKGGTEVGDRGGAHIFSPCDERKKKTNSNSNEAGTVVDIA
jgi:hypothetical protein